MAVEQLCMRFFFIHNFIISNNRILPAEVKMCMMINSLFLLPIILDLKQYHNQIHGSFVDLQVQIRNQKIREKASERSLIRQKRSFSLMPSP